MTQNMFIGGKYSTFSEIPYNAQKKGFNPPRLPIVLCPQLISLFYFHILRVLEWVFIYYLKQIYLPSF